MMKKNYNDLHVQVDFVKQAVFVCLHFSVCVSYTYSFPVSVPYFTFVFIILS